MTSSRMASSSRPMSSRSSGVRCSRRWCSWGGVLGLEVDLDRARGGGDAGADHLAVGVLDVAGAQVAHGAGVQAPDAGVADAHATAVRQQRARLLAGHQQRRRRRPSRPPCRWPGSGRGRRCRRGLPTATTGRKRSRCSRSETPARSKRSVSASSRPAGPHAQVWRSRQSGTRRSSSADVPAAVPIVVVLVQRVAVVAARRARADRSPKIVSSRRRGDVHVRGVGKAVRALRERAQHPHDRRHAAARRHEQQRMLDGLREHELARSAARAGPACPRRAWLTRCSDTSPPAMRLTVMAIRPSRRRGTDVSE